VELVGTEGTLSYRVYLRVAREGRLERVSPWHDLPLYPRSDEKTLLFVNEIPKGTRAKMEIAKDESLNPIKQDTKKGALRFYEYGPSLINYGALPQTWEDPALVHADTGCSGDNDPLDVIEIGSQMMPTGAVYEVKPLGMLGLIDGGELDWKLIAIRKEDPKAPQVHNLSDMEEHFPNLLHEVREWFRLYKTAEGKGENTYAYNGKALDVTFALQVVRDAHESWRKLKSGERANDEHLALT
jgi:inorganic pyrophosphatase